jgi:hypothetical protein
MYKENNLHWHEVQIRRKFILKYYLFIRWIYYYSLTVFTERCYYILSYICWWNKVKINIIIILINDIM